MNRAASRFASRALAAAALVSLACSPRSAGPPPAPAQLWFNYDTNLAEVGRLPALERVWRRAAAAGYTHVLLSDPKLARLGALDSGYFAHAERVKRLARELGLEVVPAVFAVGRSSALLWHDPNRAEGLPVRDAHFVVRGHVARLVPDPPVALGPRPDWQDASVRLAGGVAALRDHGGRGRFGFRLRVAPYRCYHVSVRVRTRAYTGVPLVRVASGWGPIERRLLGGRRLAFHRTLGVRATQDWTTHDVLFNSLGYGRVSVEFGAWGAARGQAEWTGWRIEEVGPVNVLRRDGAPCVIQGYVEGRDYAPIRDTLLGVTPWRGQYEEWHEPPVIRTSLPEGTELRASWYHAAVVYGRQVTCCPGDSGALALMRDEARRVRELWGARGYLMSHDEIRAFGWDESCRRRGRAPGAVLAWNVRECARLLAGATVYVWSDMFDPFHNARRDYDLVAGDLAGSWEGLGPGVVVLNWNGAKPRESLRFFARRGHRQIIAGYYDRDPREIRGWLEAARGVPGVVGVMYTTWRGDYDDLEEFARSVQAGGGPGPGARR